MSAPAVIDVQRVLAHYSEVAHAAVYPRLVERLRVFVVKYEAAPDGPLGVGLVNEDFILARDLLRSLGEL